MHRKIAAVLICVSAAAGYAQTVTKHGIATQFNQWKAYGSTNLVAGGESLGPHFTLRDQCRKLAVLRAFGFHADQDRRPRAIRQLTRQLPRPASSWALPARPH